VFLTVKFLALSLQVCEGEDSPLNSFLHMPIEVYYFM